MNCTAQLQMYFQNQYQANASVDSGGDKTLCEVLLFNCVALRQMHNLRTNETSTALARVLEAVNSPFDTQWYYARVFHKLKSVDELNLSVSLIAALGVDVSQLIQYMTPLAIERVTSGLNDKQLAQKLWPHSAQILKSRKASGKKQFHAAMRLQNNKLSFELNPKGFGFLGQGVNYYAPMSVVLLLKFLYEENREDSGYKNLLVKAANLCGQTFLTGKVTTVNQASLPLELLNKVRNSSSIS